MLNILESKIDNFQYIEISNSEIPLKDIISSYLLNSQLITNGDNEMQLILPEEVKQYENCMSWLDKLKQISDVKLLILLILGNVYEWRRACMSKIKSDFK